MGKLTRTRPTANGKHTLLYLNTWRLYPCETFLHPLRPGAAAIRREQFGTRLVTAVSMRHKLVGWDTHRHARRTATRLGRFRPAISKVLMVSQILSIRHSS